MNDKITYPHQAGGKVTEAVRKMMNQANERFGVTDGALVRMALESFLPGYLAAQGRSEHMAFFAQVGEGLKKDPSLKPEIEKLLRTAVRSQRSVA